ncbi:hypothetical protein [Flavobacterium sp. WC2429]|uniref:DUF4263 domain-containing protein n=1 Tax=Flavobacterium sp. WC2429 TaxID=3234140 RepID=A0AB39WJ29_9FLAO
MKILINDLKENQNHYKEVFRQFGYEENELLFRDSFQDTIEFITDHLEIQKGHIDLIITSEIKFLEYNSLKANELLFFIKNHTQTFSKGNFRISSIPVLLYSDYETKENDLNGFKSIVQKNNIGLHKYFFDECERLIKEWRNQIYIDLDNLGLKVDQLHNFILSTNFKNHYFNNVTRKAEMFYHNKTIQLSIEFIKAPSTLNYDWLILNRLEIENSIYKYIDTYNNHRKYDRNNGERTILHEFFKQNKIILLRDTYSDMKYELNLNEIDTKNSEECDFILKTEYPEFLKTTFFEVKKEDVTFYVKKNTKRPQISSAFLSHLNQIWNYKEFTENPSNTVELKNKLEYDTKNFDFVLLAGRIEEKEEMKHLFEKQIGRMFEGIKVVTYEELENININYLEKFNRLNG